jgi:hypothetical protein
MCGSPVKRELAARMTMLVKREEVRVVLFSVFLVFGLMFF